MIQGYAGFSPGWLSQVVCACLHCGHTLDAAVLADDDSVARPRPGDVSLCVACGTPAIFTEDGLRWPTYTEMEKIERDPVVAHAQELIRRRGIRA